MATGRLLGVTAFPLFSKISSDFCVNLLIFYPQVGILLRCQREGNRYLCLFQTQAFETYFLGRNVPRKRRFQMTRRGVSESPGETQAKPLPQVIRVPLCYEHVTGSHHQTGGLG